VEIKALNCSGQAVFLLDIFPAALNMALSGPCSDVCLQVLQMRRAAPTYQLS